MLKYAWPDSFAPFFPPLFETLILIAIYLIMKKRQKETSSADASLLLCIFVGWTSHLLSTEGTPKKISPV